MATDVSWIQYTKQDAKNKDCTNTIGNYIYTTPMPLQNESKHNDNWIKGRQPPRKNTEILIRLYLIINDFQEDTFILSGRYHIHRWYVKLHIQHSETVLANRHLMMAYTAETCSETEGEKINGLHCGRKYSVWTKSILMQQDA
jgi:hypothetical protein